MNKGKEEYCTKGWNWGNFNVTEEKLNFKINNKPCFALPFSDIVNATCVNKDEITIEFHQEEIAKDAIKPDAVCEMRFYVPPVVLPSTEGKEEKEEKKTEHEISDVQKLYQNIVKKAGIGAFAGDTIVNIPELPLITPRGKYSLDMYESCLKFYGRTHNFKILNKSVSRAFVLPKPDGQHFSFVIALTTPVKQGQTYYPFLVVHFHKDQRLKVKVNLSPDQLEKLKLEPEVEGLLHDVLARIFKSLLGIKIGYI